VSTLHHLNFHSLSSRGHHSDALSLVDIYNSFKFCPYLLETVGIRVDIRNCRQCPSFTVVSSHKGCWTASAANIVCENIDMFMKVLVTGNHTLK
jgi:hypothetical protein